MEKISTLFTIYNFSLILINNSGFFPEEIILLKRINFIELILHLSHFYEINYFVKRLFGI